MADVSSSCLAALLVFLVASASECIDVNIQRVGIIRGSSRTLEGKIVDSFQGIPYGKAPTGSRRFQAPLPADTWTGVRNSSKSTIYCPQKDIMTSKIHGDEDCLVLNIHRPRNASSVKVPVMVWIHGGSFIFGAGGDYDGEMLAAANDVVVVTINYRLGILGFFNVPGTNTKGNWGLLDQIQALKWVRDHIADFGGDPKQVTIFGESAGSASVTLLMLSTRAKGLFKRVIAQSGVPLNFWALHKRQNTSYAVSLARSLGCNDINTTTECMRGKTWKEIMDKQVGLVEAHPCATPTVDDFVIPTYAVQMMGYGFFPTSNVEVLLGFNKNEGSMFVPGLARWNETIFKAKLKEKLHWQFDKNTELVTDLAAFEYEHWTQENAWLRYVLSINDFIDEYEFKVGIVNLATALANSHFKTYLYHFTYMPAIPRKSDLGVAHGIEIGFVFGRGFFAPGDPKRYQGNLLSNFTAADRNVSAAMMKMWTDFAKTGVPSANWPLFNNTNKMYLDINLQQSVKANFNPRRMQFWNKHVPDMIKRSNAKVCPTTRPVQCTTSQDGMGITSGASSNEHCYRLLCFSFFYSLLQLI